MIVELGLQVGTELTRPVARDLRRALRRSEAVGHAERLLAQSQRSRARLLGDLERRGVAAETRETLMDDLEQAGLVSDTRAAADRARALAERGWANVAISTFLSDEGYDGETCRTALAGLDDEVARARVTLSRKRRTPHQAARFLGQRGFDPELVEELLVADAGMEG